MLQFDIPFLPNDEYLNYINSNSKHIYSVYFGTYSEYIADARYDGFRMSEDKMAEMLSKINPSIKKYALLNSRIHHPSAYLGENIERVINYLKMLNLTGIVYYDQYFLNSLSIADRDFASSLDAIPSVNFNIDTFDKFATLMEFVSRTHFQLPSKIILDRSLNRNANALSLICEQIRSISPNIKIELLANEGCLYQCPFKVVHDCLISMSHFPGKLGMKLAENINDTLGCTKYYQHNPASLLKSPFIRPEDADIYSGLVDILKISGRSNGSEYMLEVLNAYFSRTYNGNLLNLNDSQRRLRDQFYIFNDEIPSDFVHHVTTCNKVCQNCNYCSTILYKCIQELERKAL